MDRVVKVTNKIMWSIKSKTVVQPHIELVHWRDHIDSSEDSEFVRRCVGNVYIEPEFGYIICNDGYLVEESLLPNFSHPIPPWRVGLTSANAFFKARSGNGKRVEHHRSVIHLRHLWEWNYYHFYLDVLGKMQLFDKVGIDPETPIVLGRYAIELPFVQQIITQGALRRRNWIVQDNCYILADEVYYCRTRQSYKDKMNYLLDLMGISNHQDPDNDRIFLTRKPGSPRSVLNMDQVERVLRDYGFRIVDTANMPITEQIGLFSKTRYLLAVHGAGMTNMIFRRDAPMSILEIHATSYVSEDFRNMGHEWGFRYDRLACSTDGHAHSQHAKIYIDPAQLRRKIEDMLASQIA